MKKAKWIWKSGGSTQNQYVEFCEKFPFSGERTLLYIACETDYIACINDKRASFNSFAGYRDEKYYDVIDITEYCTPGENRLNVTVRYEGVNSATHIDDGAGVIFEIGSGGDITAYSSAKTLCRTDERYIGGSTRLITRQLGLTSGMKNAESGAYSLSVETGRQCRLLERPVRKLTECGRLEAKPCTIPRRKIYDLGKEYAGYLYLDVSCLTDTSLTVAYGEHLDDGCVRRRIGERNFSLDFVCRKGQNRFEQLFVRVAGRYLEVLCDDEVTIENIGIIPVYYPVTGIERHFDGTWQDIYDICVRTLRMCMHTHYEDCPWREQALYVLDSRNQMVSGYYAFKESGFARANLVFMSKGKRNDGMLELTYPAVNTPAIPFFSIMFPVSVTEYIDHTGDRSVIPLVEDTVNGIYRAVESRMEDGLISCFPAPYWNFYEWSEGNSGSEACTREDDSVRKDLVLNCAYIYSRSVSSKYFGAGPDNLNTIRQAVKKAFYGEAAGMFCDSTFHTTRFSQLGQAFALLAGLDGKNVVRGAKLEEDVTPATLSMLGFVYDALLGRDAGAKDYILEDIRKNYGYMLSKGATTFWETIEGADAFNKAGSLCHGWSAIPIRYLCEML